jgi:Holliday junction resolvasome RuvABC endonuclease subunit
MNNKWMIGVDVGFANLGYSFFKMDGSNPVLKKCGVIFTEKNSRKQDIRVVDDDIERIKKLVSEFYIIHMDTIKINDIVFAACEHPHGGAQGARPNRTMGIATGMLTTYLYLFNYPFEVVPPNDIKFVTTGHKLASKIQVMDAVVERIGGEWMEYEIKRKSLDSELGYKITKKKRYTVLGEEYTESQFEHIADSIGAVFHVMKNSEMFKIFSQ